MFVVGIIAGEPRIDGRTVDTVRALNSSRNCITHVLHGSAIFTRSETQALACCNVRY